MERKHNKSVSTRIVTGTPTTKNILLSYTAGEKDTYLCNTAARVPLLHIGAHVCAYSHPGHESDGIRDREIIIHNSMA